MRTIVVLTVLIPLAFLMLAFRGKIIHPGAGIVIDKNGQIFFADLGRGLIKIDTKGKVSTIHNEGGHWLALDENGCFSHVDFSRSVHAPRWFKRRTTLGVLPTLIGDGGSPLVVGKDGNIYFVCNDGNMIPGGLQIARLTPEGKESLLNPKLREISEKLGGIKGLAQSPDGTLYASYSKAILKIGMDGIITTLINPVVVKDCNLNVPSNDAPFLRGLTIDSHGIVYAAASGCGCIIKIDTSGKVTTVLKAEKPWAPSGVTAQEGNIYVLEHINSNSTEHESWQPRVRKLGNDGKISTLVTIK